MKVLISGLQLILLFSFFQFASCKFDKKKGKSSGVDTAAIKASIGESPVISGEDAIKKMYLEDGFEIKLVAAEPLVISPVAINFDDRGRIWACEMTNYMPDTSGTGEDKPSGKIVILEDTNKDGVMDSRKVFMDNLVLPRALCLIENGILVAEPPNLWYVEISNDKPVKKTLVDAKYAAGGNPEHQANGLFRALDNWIYSANCNSRYRKKGSKWLIERTHSRGQWGISQDNDGRMFYNNNSQNLLGDYFAPAFGAGNPNQKGVAGFEEKIVADNRVYPSRPTPGVNRGYMEGVLDDSLRLVEFTAASGPVLYRGGLFGKEYELNAFVGEPAANLIKRNILEENGFRVQGRQAYKGKEFLSSVDERFRPVTLYNGPDGGLYVVDMYRGIIQHKTYLTEYLKGEIKSRQLTEPLTCGRIYKVIPKGKQVPSNVAMPASSDSLVKLLQHPNGWIRDKAQQLIIDKRLTQAIPALKQNIKQVTNPILVNHSLWTLQGLNALQPDDIIPLLNQSNWKLQAQALTALSFVIDKKTFRLYLPVINELANKNDTLIAPYIAFIAPAIKQFDAKAANDLLLKVVQQHANNTYIADVVISTLNGKEEVFAKTLRTIIPDTTVVINKALYALINEIKNPGAKKTEGLKQRYPEGVAIFNSVCQTCHGPTGNGLKSLAPPLNKSEWVVGDKNKLIAIVLYGLTGPVKVNTKVYKAPEINGEMPGVGNNKDYTDDDIAQLLTFIRKAWSNNSGKIDQTEINEIRKRVGKRQKAFTVEELDKFR
jgi:mono/diheme cytochrome c family protein